MTDRPLIVWFRQDLRIADNPALHRGVRSGSRLVCVYVHEDDDPAHDDVPAPRPLGGERMGREEPACARARGTPMSGDVEQSRESMAQCGLKMQLLVPKIG